MLIQSPGYRLDNWRTVAKMPAGLEIFIIPTVFVLPLGSLQSCSLRVPRALSTGVKQLGCEPRHPPVSSICVKNE